MRTNIPGVFAAGDIRSKLCRQVVTVVGDGATAPTLFIFTWNNSMVNHSTRFLSILVLTYVLSGCGIIDYFYLPPPEETAQELFETGNDYFQEQNYAKAAIYYSKLKDNFPFSPYAIEAELSLADCYYRDEEWGPAVEAYKESESMHPRHEAMPYVLFT